MPRLKSLAKSIVEDQTPAEDTSPVVPLTTPPPKMTDPAWNDWVLDKLRPDEKDPQGHPNIDGLRRLVEEILGDIVYSSPDTVVGAETNNQLRATVIHRVKILWKFSPSVLEVDIREFGAAADVYPGNTDDEYARYAAATADTRAEARALRKALRLRKVVASEEITSLPVAESGLGDFIVKSQEKGIDYLCQKMDIDVLAFINSGARKYKHFSHIRYQTAQQMLEQLNRYQRDMTKIPQELLGYGADWRESGNEDES